MNKVDCMTVKNNVIMETDRYVIKCEKIVFVHVINLIISIAFEAIIGIEILLCRFYRVLSSCRHLAQFRPAVKSRLLMWVRG